MKFTSVFLVLFCLALSVANAQSSESAVTGKFVGQYKWEGGHAVISVKKNHHFVIKKYNWDGKCESTTKGEWTLDGDKLVLKESNEKSIILERDKAVDPNPATAGIDGWYIYGSRAYSYDGYFYQGMREKEYKKILRTQGC